MESIPLVNLWQIRNKILYFAILSIKQRFKGTYLGLLWTAIEPTLIFILLYTVFTSIKFTGGENFAIYLLTGVIFYHIFTRGTLSGLTSIRNNKHIIKSVKIRTEFFPVMVTVATAMLLFVQIGVFFGLMPFFEFVPPWTIIYLPLVLALLLVLTLGFSYLLSVTHVYVKDIQPLWAVIIHALFFVTPIFWYLQDANEILSTIHQYNPIGQILELGHKIVVFGEIPAAGDWLYTTIFVGAIFFVGFAVFHRFESKLTEEL